jgi:hypothetical protein
MGQVRTKQISFPLTGSFSGTFIGTLQGTSSGIAGGRATHMPYFITDTTLATSSIYQSGSFSIIINQDNNTSANPEALYVWQPHPTSFNIISGKGNLDNYAQLNIFNSNQGTNASSDVVATANNGNETTNYIDMGINSSNFSGTTGGANDAYLYSTGNHLHIGNASSNQYVGFFAGGSDVDTNMKLLLDPSNQHQMTGSLDISGSLTSSTDISINGINIGRGNSNIATNTVFGVGAGSSVTDATHLVAIGYAAGRSITTAPGGIDSVMIGYQAGATVTTGVNNVYIGWQAGSASNSNNNTFIGNGAGPTAVGGSNTAVGSLSARVLRSGSNNSFYGYQAGYNLQSGSYNNFIGYYSGWRVTSGSYNTFVGSLSGSTLAPFLNTVDNSTIIGNLSQAFVNAVGSTLTNNIILMDGQSNIKYRWDGTQNNIYGNLVISGSISGSSFILPTTSSASPQTGSAYWSGSLLFIWNGSRYMSSSFV